MQWGGIGIDRRPKAAGEERPSMVEVMSDLFKTHPKLVMLVRLKQRVQSANNGKLAFIMWQLLRVFQSL